MQHCRYLKKEKKEKEDEKYEGKKKDERKVNGLKKHKSTTQDVFDGGREREGTRR